jgi:hypothetical protein
LTINKKFAIIYIESKKKGITPMKHCDNCLIKDSCQVLAISKKSCGNPIIKENLIICDFCGNAMLPNQATVEPNGHISCPRCAQLNSACGSCSHATECLFETDPSPLPKVVVQTVRNGNMTIQQQVRNPAREEITCKKCNCYNDTWHCMRSFQSRCVNFISI